MSVCFYRDECMSLPDLELFWSVLVIADGFLKIDMNCCRADKTEGKDLYYS